jgi:hypothetical protein
MLAVRMFFAKPSNWGVRVTLYEESQLADSTRL